LVRVVHVRAGLVWLDQVMTVQDRLDQVRSC